MSVGEWTLTFEVAFDTDPDTEPGVNDWTDLTDRVRVDPAVVVTYGSGRLSGGGPGACTLHLDNADRELDPTNTSATYNLIPMRHARLQVEVDATTYDLFRGYVDAWPPVWSVHRSADTVALELVDGIAWLGLQDGTLDLAEQLSSVRVTALLDAAGWPAGRRDIDTGIKTVTAVEFDNQNLLRVILDTVEAEGGELWVAPDGDVAFRSKHHRLNSVNAATFGPSDIQIAAMSPAYDTATITNCARVGLSSGDIYTYEDSDSIDDFGPRNLTVRDLPLSGPEAESVAQWEVVRFKDALVWMDALTVRAETATGVVEQLLPLRVGDLVNVLDTPDDGSSIDLDLTIERITHRFTSTTWATSLDLSPYFGEGPWLELNDATLGLLGDNKLAP